MQEQRDYSLIFLRIFAIAVFAVISLTVCWIIAAQFPNVSIFGWLIVLAYMGTAFLVPTVVAPYLSNRLKISDYTAWKIAMAVWVSSTAIVGVLAWPMVSSYVSPLFMAASYVG